MIPFQVGARVRVRPAPLASGWPVILRGLHGTITAPSAWPHDWIVLLDALEGGGPRTHSFQQENLVALSPLELLAEVADG